MRSTLSKWIEDCAEALQKLERDKQSHEAAIERAMLTIRQHTNAMERIDKNIVAIENALESIDGSGDVQPPAAAQQVVPLRR